MYEKYFYRIIRTSEAMIYIGKKKKVYLPSVLQLNNNKKSSINPIKTWADALNIFPKKTSK